MNIGSRPGTVHRSNDVGVTGILSTSGVTRRSVPFPVYDLSTGPRTHMERRDLLKAMGAATVLALLPHETFAAWSRVGSGLRPAGGLSEGQLRLVGAIADTIFPRTDSPSATDVGVDGFIDVIVTEQASETDRASFLAGLDAIDAQSRTADAAGFVALSADARGAARRWLGAYPPRG